MAELRGKKNMQENSDYRIRHQNKTIKKIHDGCILFNNFNKL